MKFEDIVTGNAGWLSGDGPEPEIVLSSRIRLARNLNKHRFPNRATPEEKIGIMTQAVKAIKKVPRFSNMVVLNMAELDAIDKQFLSERYLISREQAQKGEGSAVVINDQQMLSIMINEEDHLRIQVLMPGLQLRQCWEIINEIDDCLSSSFLDGFSLRVS